MQQGITHKEAVRLAKETLGEATPQELAAYILQTFGLKMMPAIVSVLLGSMQERATLERSGQAAYAMLEQWKAENPEEVKKLAAAAKRREAAAKRKAEAAKVEEPKAEVAKVEEPKVEEPKVEEPKAEAPVEENQLVPVPEPAPASPCANAPPPVFLTSAPPQTTVALRSSPPNGWAGAFVAKQVAAEGLD